MAAPAPAAPATANEPGRDCTAEVAALTSQVQAMSAELYGAPMDWGTMPPHLTAEGFEDEARAAIDACDVPARFVEADCTEPPCFAVLAANRAGPGRSEVDEDVVQMLEGCDAWTERFGVGANKATWSAGSHACADETSDRVFMVAPIASFEHLGEDKEVVFNLWKRKDLRWEDLSGGYACAGD